MYGTKLWQRSFKHVAMGEFGGRLPLGSWVLLQSLETTCILRNLAHQENPNLDVFDVNTMQVVDEGGFAASVVCVIIADNKAQVALSGCRNFKNTAPLTMDTWGGDHRRSWLLTVCMMCCVEGRKFASS